MKRNERSRMKNNEMETILNARTLSSSKYASIEVGR